MNNPTAWDHHLDGNNLHGVYGSFGSWIKDSKVEPYVLLRTGLRKSWTYGLRSAGKIGSRWNYETEALGQHSDQWAGLLQMQRHFRDFRWTPTLMGETNYASGGLDQLYPTNHSIYGIADQIGRRNTKNVRGARTVAPVAGGAKYTDVGPELDLLADVKLSRFYDIGAQYGHLFPGKFLETYSNGAGRSFYAVFLDFHL